MKTISPSKSSAGTLGLILAFSCSSVPLIAAQRVALVIGNNHYTELPDRMQLTSPVADATDVAAALKALGYVIITGQALTDASRDAITTATEKFAAESKGAEAAVFFYSGHGVQVGEDNYILPTDTPKLTGMSMLKNRGVLLRDSIMVGLEEAGAKTKVVILDCCRDNPFSAQLDAALSGIGKSMKTKSVGEITGYGPGFYLAFATSPGTTASDGNGQRNSPFTAAMLNAIPKSAGKDIDFFFRDVKVKLGADQVSWTNHSLTDSFSLGAATAGTAATSAPPPSGGPVGTADLEKLQLQREIAELKRSQAQLAEAPPMAAATIPAGDLPPSASMPTDLPATGFFERAELFAMGPYRQYNATSQTFILKQAQEKLKKMGYYKGNADGARGPSTQKALNDWQREQHIGLTGRLDVDSIGKLGLAGIAELSAVRAPSKPATAAHAPNAKASPPPAANKSVDKQDLEKIGKLIESDF
jgi:uncharacterized caspase-like protein